MIKEKEPKRKLYNTFQWYLSMIATGVASRIEHVQLWGNSIANHRELEQAILEKFGQYLLTYDTVRESLRG